MSFLRKHWLGITLGVLAVAAAVALVIIFPPTALVPVIATVAAALTSPPAIVAYLGLGVVATVGLAVLVKSFFARQINRQNRSPIQQNEDVLVGVDDLVEESHSDIVYSGDMGQFLEQSPMVSFSPDSDVLAAKDIKHSSPLAEDINHPPLIRRDKKPSYRLSKKQDKHILDDDLGAKVSSGIVYSSGMREILEQSTNVSFRLDSKVLAAGDIDDSSPLTVDKTLESAPVSVLDEDDDDYNRDAVSSDYSAK